MGQLDAGVGSVKIEVKAIFGGSQTMESLDHAPWNRVALMQRVSTSQGLERIEHGRARIEEKRLGGLLFEMVANQAEYTSYSRSDTAFGICGAPHPVRSVEHTESMKTPRTIPFIVLLVPGFLDPGS